MRALIASIALLMCVGFSTAQVFGFGRCPDVRGVADFNENWFAGKWYVIANFYAYYSDGWRCATTEYMPTDTPGLAVTVNTAVDPTGNMVTYRGRSVAPEPERPAYRIAYYEGQEPVNYTVLDTDYDTYALTYSCSQYFFGLINIQYSWVLARSPSPERETWELAYQRAYYQGINYRKYLISDQMNCNDEPEPSRPRTEGPEPSRPRTDGPEPSRPRTDGPEPSRPRTDGPEPSRPRTDMPRTDDPRTDRPRTEMPQTDRPRTENPGSDMPGSDRPRSEAP